MDSQTSRRKHVAWLKLEHILLGHVVSAYLSAEQNFRCFSYTTFEHAPFSFSDLQVKPHSKATRSHKRLFLRTSVWPLLNMGILPSRDSGSVKEGFCISDLCFNWIRKIASLEKNKRTKKKKTKTHLNIILKREIKDKARCIRSRGLRVLQYLLLVPCSTDTTSKRRWHLWGCMGNQEGQEHLCLFVSKGDTRWLCCHPSWHSSIC